MTPMEYIKENISISSARKQLYNIIFNRHIEENEEGEKERKLIGKVEITYLMYFIVHLWF